MKFSKRYYFSDWPNTDIRQVAAGVYAIWNSDQLIYCEMSVRGIENAVATGRKKPYYLNPHKSRKGTAYYRHEDQSIKASKELVTIIKEQSKKTDGYTVTYTDNHKEIMHLFTKHEYLSISKIQEEIAMKRHEISKALTSLVLTSVLQVRPLEKEDQYYPAPAE